jgi:hypothetical protein
MSIRIVKHTPDKLEKVYYTVEERFLFWWITQEAQVSCSSTGHIAWVSKHYKLSAATEHKDELLKTHRKEQKRKSVKWVKEVLK